MSSVESKIRDAKGIVLGVNAGSATQAEVHNYFSRYFKGAYLTATQPQVEYKYIPYTIIIDLETMEVVNKTDLYTSFTTQQVLSMMNQIAND